MWMKEYSFLIYFRLYNNSTTGNLYGHVRQYETPVESEFKQKVDNVKTAVVEVQKIINFPTQN